MNITRVNDSSVSVAGTPTQGFSFNTITLVYHKTDSTLQAAVFFATDGPPILYFYYNTGVIHFKIDQSGIHSDDLELWTP